MSQRQVILNTIRQESRRLGAPKIAEKAAIESGIVESGLRNLGGGDRDSEGYLQQRPSQGWPDPTNIRTATRSFLKRAIPLAGKYKTSGDLAAAVQRPAAQYAGRYAQHSREAEDLLKQNGGAVTSAPVTSQTTSKSVADSAALAQASRRQILASFLAKTQGTNSPLFQSGVLSTKAVDPSQFKKTVTTTQKTTPMSKSVGSIKVAQGAERPGHYLQPVTKKFLRQVAGKIGGSIEVTTGTNHNQFVAGENGVQSDHWTGNAGDIGLGGDARQDSAVASKGDRIAAAALETLGVPRTKALADARKGGVFTITKNNVRYQVLWKTMVGGNHYNHVHLGAKPI